MAASVVATVYTAALPAPMHDVRICVLLDAHVCALDISLTAIDAVGAHSDAIGNAAGQAMRPTAPITA